MGSSCDRLFRRERSVHEILGAGLAGDVILWRKKNVSVTILVVTISAWFVFEKTGYTLLSLVSSVLLLLILILFTWSKSASILNRPAPPLPELHLSEEMVNEAACFIRTHVNSVLSASRDIALGKDSKLFVKVAGCLFLLSIVGAMTDFLTLAYTSIVIVLTIPKVYERYEDHIDKCVICEFKRLRRICILVDIKRISKSQSWFLEKRKLS